MIPVSTTKSPPSPVGFLLNLFLTSPGEAISLRIPAARTRIIDFLRKMSITRAFIDATKSTLSSARISTYEAAAGTTNSDDPSAIALYAWNAAVSAALMPPIHICEVVIRNAVSEAIEAVHGPRWPWDRGFVRNLHSPHTFYSPRRDLEAVAAQQPTTGKVIPELKFVFWQEMFTARYDARIWHRHLKRVLPLHDPTKTFVALRREIYADLEVIRKLRNRIAHHEPIFRRNLSDDLARVAKLVGLKCQLTESWMLGNQVAESLILTPPLFKGGRLWVPSHEEIAVLAYRYWCDGGKRPGTADRDWAAAERFLATP